MSDRRLAGKRVLITQADAFMSPTLCWVFAEHGADVVTYTRALIDVHLPAAIVAAAARVGVLVANLALPAPSTPAVDVSKAEWRETFAALIDPLPRLVRAVLPQMIARWSGKILLIGSASALRGIRAPRPTAPRAAPSSLISRPSVSRSPRTTCRSTPSSTTHQFPAGGPGRSALSGAA